MKRLVWLISAAALGAGGILVACSSPTEPHPAIPTFAASNGRTGDLRAVPVPGCFVWSCATGDCLLDPAQYGACCVIQSNGTPEEPVTTKPSCAYTGPGANNNCGPGTPNSGPFDCERVGNQCMTYGNGYTLGSCNIGYSCCYNPDNGMGV